ncbi:hypothetical protein KBY58_00750 [Cyanobium sp. HWJ4-Hawea]|uniref:hypothetical protein n=1 Tax=Cyanobium sp. HWJ4-Hawea TaxID=2823713 RepID=UPI0020CF9333|nr:hypothetical protein [Cyanobium sp. HWJ4-Hawea]MCP9807960.1 hypothetical protein [Cyanobium sp. HWJ4-Hawea]
MQLPQPKHQHHPAIAIRGALERGWKAFRHCPWVLMGFTLVSGGTNLLSQLLYRYESSRIVGLFGHPDGLAVALAGLAWLAYAATSLWLVVGLMRGAQLALAGQRPSLQDLMRLDGRAMARCGGTLLLILVLNALILRFAQASAWLLTLLQPWLAPIPLVAGVAVAVYLAADQILCLPLTLIGGLSPLASFRSGRAAVDPHWLHALGLTLVVLLILLAGFLVLPVGLLVALPVTFCTLAAAYGQLFAEINSL